MNKTYTLKITNLRNGTIKLLNDRIVASNPLSLVNAHKELTRKLWNTGTIVEFIEV